MKLDAAFENRNVRIARNKIFSVARLISDIIVHIAAAAAALLLRVPRVPGRGLARSGPELHRVRAEQLAVRAPGLP